MCGFIIFDTQNITEKARRGDKDYIKHSVELFIDFVAVFKRILIILTDRVNLTPQNMKLEVWVFL